MSLRSMMGKLATKKFSVRVSDDSLESPVTLSCDGQPNDYSLRGMFLHVTNASELGASMKVEKELPNGGTATAVQKNKGNGGAVAVDLAPVFGVKLGKKGAGEADDSAKLSDDSAGAEKAGK